MKTINVIVKISSIISIISLIIELIFCTNLDVICFVMGLQCINICILLILYLIVRNYESRGDKSFYCMIRKLFKKGEK